MARLINNRKRHYITTVLAILCNVPTLFTDAKEIEVNASSRLAIHEEGRVISKIEIRGNNHFPTNAIIAQTPFQLGTIFSANTTSRAIKKIYSLGYFQQVKIFIKPVGQKNVKIIIEVVEKPTVSSVTFNGNKSCSTKDLEKEINRESLKTIVEQELKSLVNKIKKFYIKKHYHAVSVKPTLTKSGDNSVAIHFEIKEGKKSFLNHIDFKGNKTIPTKKLRRIVISQEDWILGFLSGSGGYNPEMSEADKYMIEEAYHNLGFMNASVVETVLKQDPVTNNFHITYVISEGDRYSIKKVEAIGNEKISGDRLRMVIPIYEGSLYSRKNITSAMENLKKVWGEYGYIFADINPDIDVDDATKTVSITFNSDLKEPVYLNRLNIKGNSKTKDRVVRRLCSMQEGDLITNNGMDIAKAKIGLLGYFDARNGVEWKITRISDSKADLDLMLQEIKTGSLAASINYGGKPSQQSPATGLNLNLACADRNLFGSGISSSLNVDLSKQQRSAVGAFGHNWLCDRPIQGVIQAHIKSAEYDEQIKITTDAPLERSKGLMFGLGYVIPHWNGISIDGKFFIESIRFENRIKAAQHLNYIDQAMADIVLGRSFQSGNQLSLIGSLGQDLRNGLAFATNGYQWNLNAQLTLPGWHMKPNCENSTSIARFNYFRLSADANWLTPLINDYDLVFSLHGHAGIIQPINNGDIPWKNLYHIGGPGSVRGYLYGEVGPSWFDSPLGSSRALFVNAELIIPVSADLNTRVVVFYDGGAGWHYPYLNEINLEGRAHNLNFEKNLINNNFFYRHTVGIGVRMKSPTPLQVDFGIKLNPSKKYRNHLTEIHFGMEQAF